MSARTVTRPPSRSLLRSCGASIALGASLFALGACGGGSVSAVPPGTTAAAGSSQFAGAELPQPVPAPPFTLQDSEGRSVSLAGYRGTVTVLAFLDSSCRACELIGQQIRGALDELTRPAPVLIVSVDPAGDTPVRVRGFLQRVGLAARARFLVGPRGALASVWRAYRTVTPDRGREAFEAAASVYLLDRAGRERVIYQQEELTPEALAHDIRALQRG